MTSLTVNDAQCAALFVSRLQRSDAPSGDAVARAVTATVRQFGARGCVALMAQEFGDHPEASTARMQWVRQLIRELAAASASRASVGIAA
jgi:hypothetical protein